MTALNTPSDAEMALMSELGIRFDGLRYCYRQYRYDSLKDATNYARQDQRQSDYRPQVDPAPVWTAPAMPTEEQLQQMAEAGVTFDGRYYHFAEFRYDLLADAIRYAHLSQ